MTIRETIEDMERATLSPYATLNENSRGRQKDEPQCDIRPLFQRDRDRILHSKAFRRLKNKTQVFLAPKGDHYRTRLSHTLEVSQNARTIAKALRLNEDLVEAIALGHDLGHTPFGHCGERTLNGLCSTGFIHSEQSVRIVEKLEKEGEGLNLTWEVRDGIRNHQTKTNPATPEGKVVRLSDKIAYINHDIDDAIRAQILCEEDIPLEIRKAIGMTSDDRLDNLIHDVISCSLNNMKIMDAECRNDLEPVMMSEEMNQAMYDLREFMFENLYTNPYAKGEEVKAQRMLTELYNYYLDRVELLPAQYINMIEQEHEDVDRVVCDYIAGMTDQYAINKFNEVFMPMSWMIVED
ncbi:MAG: deoxyguanosinetriphosphate triphosphohydrolase [Lachnospiraceae bacterium]|jgi:dGTPase|nr:deoxyguanosinetriphosphate triphosphohydrolase [Lachnospiraceae bacterium]